LVVLFGCFRKSINSKPVVGALDAGVGRMGARRRQKTKVMKSSETTWNRQPRHQPVGYVVAENVIKVTRPDYNYDNIAREADEIFVTTGGWKTRPNMERDSAQATKENRFHRASSFAIIKKAFEAVR
jgi:hypothetical protein